MYRMAVLSVLFTVSLCAQPDESGWSFHQGDWTLLIDAQGAIILQDGVGEKTLSAASLTTAIDGAAFNAAGFETEAIKDGVEFRYRSGDSPEPQTRYRIEFLTLGGFPTICRTVTMSPPTGTNVRIQLETEFSADPQDMTVFAPRIDGMGVGTPFEPAHWYWPLGPEPESGQAAERQLAIPFVSVAAPKRSLRLTVIGDPFWGADFSLDGAEHARVMLASRHSEPFTRTYWTVLDSGGPEVAMNAWYATALADVPEGPVWLHDVAWQHYDYLSHGGEGWFEDIDALESLIAPSDRSKIVFTLHGWYDLLGRYTFDADTGRLGDTWTAFPNADAVKDKGFTTSRSFPMSKAEMHRRIRYAKDRGFRVALYFADGLTACEGAGRFTEDRVLYWGGWNGPDTLGKSYAQNPLHPDVYQWYVDYLKALLAEYGREIDALVWDETFMVRAHTMSPETAPQRAYAAPAMMRLTRDLTKLTTGYRSDLAFLVSDCIGATTDEVTRWTDVPPYAIMAHGCYQDSHSRPSVWPYGIFPNYRNILWSCNWRAVTNFGWTEFGVEHYDTPLATSNGWLDDKGIARLSEEERNAVFQLFQARKDRRQDLHWLTGPPPVFREQD
ncbi:MAG: hypothetical protein IT365_00140 [Candidatus Hydrogenedentes bacterium]|nr:hypothetical protein [Candidatus Hydrogenedentota bacterium]